MRSATFTCLLFVVLLIWTMPAAGQEAVYSNYQHYTTEDGLPQNYVSSIVQDQDGFIWVATLDGIARFDGKNFVEFNITSDSIRKISTPRVLDLKIDKDNNLWILHFNQKVDLMNPKTLQVERDVKPILKASYEEFPLAMSYKSSFYFTFAETLADDHWFVKNKFEFHLFDSTDYKLAQLFSAKKKAGTHAFGYDEDERGRLWILGSNSLQVSDSTWRNIKTIPFPEELHLELDSLLTIFCITHISNGRILVFANERLIIYDELNNEFRELELPVKRSKKANHATIATRDQDGRVVFKYYGYVFRVNDDESITTLWKYPERDRFLISSILITQDGTLWVGINTGGLYRINTLVPTFQSKRYEQNFLVDLLTNEMAIAPSQIPENWFQNKGSYDFKYFYSKNGRLYFTQDGYYFGRLDRIFYLVGDQMQEVKSLGTTHYFKGFHDEDGFLSAIDSYGDYYQWENTSTDPVIRKCIELGNPNYFQLIDMTYADGYTWVIDTQNRIYQLKGDSILKVNEVGDKNFGFIQLLQDTTEENIFWIASYGGGLLKWNYVTSKVEKTFTKDDGLPDNTVASMILDENGSIWMSTFNGITQFDPQSERFINYSTADGLIQSEFDRHHGFKLPDGRIAFGGTSGYSVFDPKLFVEDEFSPTVKLTRLEINYQEQVFGDSLSLLDRPLNELSDLDLSYSDNSVAFEYSAMQFNAPDKNLYRYKLSGYNDDWIINGTDRKIKFDKLRTGNYTLSLNASNTNGHWSSNVREILIRVLPPPWLSWWAYTLYFIVATGILFLFWKSYKSRLQKQQEVEFNRREALRLKEVDDMKTRFFSNITHEFRTPLTLILSPLEKQLRDKKYPEEVQRILESNYRHGSHLLKLVNELLDISKLESGFMQSHQSTGQLAVFLKAIIDDFNEMASQKEVDLSLEIKNIEGYHQFDKGHLEKIVRNLLSNALKFTSQNGSVRLVAEVVENRELILEVRDTGIGIPEEQLSKLFDRFYQVDDTATRAFEGTGIGLSLVKELTDLMGGTIAVRSTLGKGSVFRVELPISMVLSPGELTTGTEKMVTETWEGAPIILVVEDNAELRSFIMESLAESAEVISANNGKEGWSLILDRMPDIVVSDVMMPEMDGYELCQKTKSDARTSHIPFILLTAKSAQESKEKGLEAGADDYLTKPFHMYELELRIQNAFRQQNNLREFLRKDYLALDTKAKNPQTKDAFLLQLDNLLTYNLTNETVGVDWLASEMSMSQSTLNRKLKALLGFSAVEFIRQTRLQKAIVLLASGHPISEVAYQVGFESPSYFSQCFKEVYHLTPTEYQQNNT